MARKSVHQKQREMTLRGRSIHVAAEASSPVEEIEETNDSTNPNEHQAGTDGENAVKTKNINEITGIPELEVETEDEEEEVEEIEDEEEIVQETEEQSTEIPEEDPKTEHEDLMQIEQEDVEEEIEYWNQAVVCYILGANPPSEVIEGFIRRIWTKFNIDKISFMPNGVFLVRFKSVEMKDKVLNSGYYMFDNKPMIVKSWTRDLEMRKEEVSSVPAWIRMHNLPLKFWGKGLPKITSLVGNYIKSDVATEEKTRLGYARVMAVLMVDQDLPEKVKFKDENGNVIQIEVEYEWRPVKCKKCMGMGHLEKTAGPTPANPPGSMQVPIQNTEARNVTPIKILVQMQRQDYSGGGYSSDSFGAHSYKEVVSSPPRRSGGANETKIKSRALKKVVNNFNNWCISTNNGHHNGGRIWILWQPQAVKVQFIEYNAQFIHMRVESVETRSIFYMTMVYAFNSIHDRAPLWDHLRRIASQVSGPWAIAGDFNCVLSVGERVGGNTPSGEMEPFRHCVADCGVIDIDATWSLFTWNNKQKPEERIYSRIDRFLVNKDWCDHLPDLYAHFLPEGLMDHTPCIISSSKNSQRKRCFKYFNMWGDAKEFLHTVRSNWDKNLMGTSMFRLVKNLKQLKPALKSLNKEGYADIEHSTRRLQKQVHDLQEQLGRNPIDTQLLIAEFEVSQELKTLSSARESFLAQKAKQLWMKEGDTNSAYFHGILKKKKEWK
ncbi:uncharacterized protein LOC141617369 [Silene latifolia]|uniref:uncharacterized protein LOC141617369 n=1 Tax=Silene latifolia TaxID=37657 RepID=UPI003D777765